MTQMRRLLYAATFLSIMTLSSCSLSQMTKMAKEQELTVEPSPLELHGDSVRFTMTATLPVKMLKKGKEYIVKPYYVYGGQEIELENIVFRADDYPNSDDQQPRISETIAFAYEPEMKQGELFVQGVARNPENDKTKETDRMKVADGVITTSGLVQDRYAVAYADHGYNNQEELIPTSIGFFFQQGSSYLRPSEVRSERGKYLENFIADKNVTRTVTITGTHSPEGAERINKRLSGDRAQRIEDFYRRNMRKYDYKGMADSIEFILKPVVEDWTALKVALEEYEGVDQGAKQEMLNIINGAGSFEEKEDALHKVNGYRKVFSDIYPLLRTAKAEILTVKEKKTDAEIATLARQIADGSISADTLSDEELGYAASLTPSLEEKERIFLAATKKNDSPASHNNLGAVYLQMAEQAANEAERNEQIEKAITQFELANRKQANAESYANLAVAYFMQGDKGRAFDMIRMAEQNNPTEATSREIRSVKGSLEISRGEYDNAIQTLSGLEDNAENLYNLGLAYLLNKDYENALTRLNEAIEMDSSLAKAYYAAAVANARLGNDDAAFNMLEKAAQADPEFKRTALEDLEFSNYREEERFRNTLR